MSQLLSQDGSDEAQATPETLNEEYFPGRNTERKAPARLNLLSEVTNFSAYIFRLVDRRPKRTKKSFRRGVGERLEMQGIA